MSTQVVTEVPTVVATAVRAVDAVKVYGSGATEVRALDGINVEFAAGRWTAIMGPSGSGKSTLLHCMAGLDSLTSGAVFIGDTDLTTLGDKRLTVLRHQQIGSCSSRSTSYRRSPPRRTSHSPWPLADAGSTRSGRTCS